VTTAPLRLAKLHATGNDFVVWASRDGGSLPADVEAFARAVCNRHTGVGADGLILLTSGTNGADATMTLHNADGHVAEMSGNGARCLAWVAAREGFTGDTLVVDTGGGRRAVALDRSDDGTVTSATVDMGPVTFEPAQIPLDAPSAFDLTTEYHGVTYHGDAAGMGNPHLVLFVDDPASARVTQHGPHLEHDPRFPRRTNVEFVAPDGDGGMRMRVWERGVGETLSCGTGACAVAAVAHRRGLVGDRVSVHVPGGVLVVDVGDTIRLGGPVVHVFDVDIDPGALEEGGRP
jgi:diaminopimelate epimerase